MYKMIYKTKIGDVCFSYSMVLFYSLGNFLTKYKE